VLKRKLVEEETKKRRPTFLLEASVFLVYPLPQFSALMMKAMNSLYSSPKLYFKSNIPGDNDLCEDLKSHGTVHRKAEC
jgi:hypothetical protein